MHARWPLLFSALTLLGACAPRPRTQVMIVVDAQDGVKRRTSRLEVKFRSGTAVLGEFQEWPVAVTYDSWPRHLGVVPQRGVRGQRYEFVASAFDASNQRLGTVRAVSGFVEGRTGELVLLIEDCCEAVSPTCTEEQTCRNCMCADPYIEPEDIPVLQPDGGMHDDAAISRDAAISPDAMATVDAFAAPDAQPPPTVLEGADCDPADVANHCITGTVCTCDSPQGCASAAPPRCYALSTISCARPIDISARLIASGGNLSVAFNASTTTAEVISGGCPNPGQDLVYLLRNTTTSPRNVQLSAGTTYDFWFDCAPGAHVWNTDACSVLRSQSNFPTSGANSLMYIFVQGPGTYPLSISIR